MNFNCFVFFLLIFIFIGLVGYFSYFSIVTGESIKYCFSLSLFFFFYITFMAVCGQAGHHRVCGILVT